MEDDPCEDCAAKDLEIEEAKERIKVLERVD